MIGLGCLFLFTATTCAGPGLLDSTFAPTLDGAVYAAAFQPDGRILIGGNFTRVNGVARNHLARLYPDGSLDTNFLATGSGVSGVVNCLLIQPDGRVLIGGDFASVGNTTRHRVARLNVNGTVDGSFNPGDGPSAAVNSLGMQSDGRVVIGGTFFVVASTNRSYVAGLNADGSLDVTFNPRTGINGPVNALAVQSDGKVVIGGMFTTVFGLTRNRIARLLPDGSVDQNFQSGLGGASGTVRAVVLLATGKVLLAGDFMTVNAAPRGRVAQLNTDGSLDTGFNPNATSGLNGPVYALAVQANNSIIAAGDFTAFNALSRIRVARLYPDGTADTTFLSGLKGASALVRCVAMQPNGQPVVGGEFATFNGLTQARLARLYGDLYPPEIVSQPISRNTNVGASVSFTVTVSNPTPSNYQWRKDGTNLAGASGESYSLSNVQLNDAGNYSVFVNNAVGGITSSNAVLNVGIAPAITSQPASLIVTQGQSATFTVTVTGTQLNYFWKNDGIFIKGATNSSYTIASVVASDAATYTCQVSNFLGSITSSNATLTVYSQPVITVQPASQFVGVSSNFTVSVTAIGYPAPAFQWNKDGSDIPGATASSYTVTGAQTNDAGGYVVVLTNLFGVVTSSVAIVNVGYTPVIVLQPLSVTNYPSGTASFSCTVTGSLPMNLQWLFNGAPALNQTNSTLTLTNLQSSDFGYYALTATNIFGGTISSNAELHDAFARTWTSTGDLTKSRARHSATLLIDGRVLVAGGYDNNQMLISSAELYNPSNGTWTAVGELATGRALHTATLLPNGKVLVAGGGSTNGIPVSSVELFDPATMTWTATNGLSTPRYTHTATLLPNGKVLVAAGVNLGGFLATCEIFDPETGTWTPVGAMAVARAYHRTVLLPDGKVLAEAGYGPGYLSSAELYEPVAGTWTSTGTMITARWYHTATLLSNGQVLVAGGDGNGGELSRAEVYNPAAGAWTATNSMISARSLHTATLLPNGGTLVVGGQNGSGALSSAEVYGAATGIWTGTGLLAIARAEHTATLLLDGRVLVVGGWGTNGALSSAELYDKATATVTLGSLMQTYDGTARSATATTIPPGLAVNFTYNSSANAPTNVGSYTVFAMINDPSYQGSATNTLVILPSPAPIVLTDATMQPNGRFRLGFTNTPGLSFSVLATTNVALSSISWTVLGSATETRLGSGQFQFIDSQATNGPQRFYRIRSQ